MTYQNHTALLIDAENTPISKLATYLEKWRPFDREITLKRAYGNWSNPCLKNWEPLLRAHAIRPVQLFDCANGKNAADIALVADAMELLHTGQYDTFVIMSSDSDYTPLVMKLREAGVNIMGIGKDDASEAYRNACTHYICFHNIYTEEPDSLQAMLEHFGFGEEDDEPTNERCDLIDEKKLLDDDEDALDTSFLFDEDETLGEDKSIAEDPFADLDELPILEEEPDFSAPVAKGSVWNSLFEEEEEPEVKIEGIEWDSIDDLLNELDEPDEAAEDPKDETVWDTLDEDDCDATLDWPPISGIGKDGKIIWETISTVDENGDVIWDTLDDDFPEIISQEDLTPKMRSVHKLLHIAYEFCKDQNGYALLSSIGNFMKEIRPEFDYRDYGFKQLHELLLAYPDKYQLVKYPKKVMAFRCCA